MVAPQCGHGLLSPRVRTHFNANSDLLSSNILFGSFSADVTKTVERITWHLP